MVQSVDLQVADPILVKKFSVNQALSPDKVRTFEQGRQDWTGAVEDNRKFDFSSLSEEEKEKLNEELERHNKEFSGTGKYLKFKYHEEAETSVVEVINASTHEVIVSLPPEFLIDLSLKLKKILGIYIDEKL